MSLQSVHWTCTLRLIEPWARVLPSGPVPTAICTRKEGPAFVINTCPVTENGDTDTRRLVNRVRRLNPASRIALVGCQAQVQKAALTTLPNVRWVVGNARKMDLVDIFR